MSNYNYSSLANKRILITGSNGGIGTAVVNAFLEHGAQVFLTFSSYARYEEYKTNLDQLANTDTKHPHQNRSEQISGYFIGDIAIAKNANNCVSQAAASMNDGIDIFIHAAGCTQDSLLINMTTEQWDKVMQINLNSAFHFSKAIIPIMIKQKFGRIIFITSVVSRMSNIGQANYISSKSALTGLSRSLALEYAAFNITSNCIEPGFIDTDMTRNMPDKQRAKLLAQIPLQHIGTPEDIAKASLFLADSNYITGASLAVNGGIYF